MWTASCIRRHIFNLPADQPFTTRDCLGYGVRSAVDQALYRLVKNGTIRRLARGIFVRDERTYFSVFEIAKLRAKAFGRKLMRHDFVIPTTLEPNAPTMIEPKLFINCRTTQLQIDGKATKLHGISERKMRLNESKTGQALQALWKMGKHKVNREVIGHACFHFGRTDRQEVDNYMRWLPAWLNDFFITKRYSCKKEALALENMQPKILVRLL